MSRYEVLYCYSDVQVMVLLKSSDVMGLARLLDVWSNFVFC